MDSRERVRRCLNHEEPDRVPIDFWASNETWTRLFQRFGVSAREPILQRFDVDFRYLAGDPDRKSFAQREASQSGYAAFPRRGPAPLRLQLRPQRRYAVISENDGSGPVHA